jgi:hypothetical protein
MRIAAVKEPQVLKPGAMQVVFTLRFGTIQL